MCGYGGVDHGCAGTVVVAVLAELDLELLHLVVMEILLDQVALSLYSSLHIGRNVGNHPGHKELDNEHHML